MGLLGRNRAPARRRPGVAPPGRLAVQRPLPLWSLVLAGAVAARAGRVLATTPTHPLGRAQAPPPQVLERGPARDLRALPGIGDGRARALVEARWRRGPQDPPLLLRDLPGLGPAVEAAVRAFLAPHGAGGTDSP
jgi:hypothetical protein